MLRKYAFNPNMRIFLILLILAPFFQLKSQSFPEKKISLDDAISLALLNNSNLNAGDVKSALVGMLKKPIFNWYMKKIRLRSSGRSQSDAKSCRCGRFAL